MSFNLSSQEYEYMQKVVFSNENKKGRGHPRQDDEAEITGTDIFVQQHQKPEEQGFFADFVDSVQMGAWQGGSDLARGLGVVFNSDWLNDTADWAAHKAKEQENTMSTKMREALGQSAFEGWDSKSGEGKGLLNAYLKRENALLMRFKQAIAILMHNYNAMRIISINGRMMLMI